jgi:hypothetical protein
MCYILSLCVSIVTGRRIFEICPARAASQPAYEVANVTDEWSSLRRVVGVHPPEREGQCRVNVPRILLPLPRISLSYNTMSWRVPLYICTFAYVFMLK